MVQPSSTPSPAGAAPRFAVRRAGRAFFGLAALALAAGRFPAAQAGKPAPLRPLFDARLSLKAGKPTAAETALLKGPVRDAARKHWGKDPDVEEAFEIIDLASGSFTRPGAKQRAVSYILARVGHNFGRDGIAVLENGRVVAHVAYQGAWENALGALPDINGNGLSELLTAAAGINMGYSWQAVGLLEFTRTGVKDLGIVRVYEDDCGAGERKGIETAYRLLAAPGAPPAFYREEFTRPCESRRAWRANGGRKRCTPEQGNVEYVRLSP